jgi:hypothetical protein
LPWHRPRPPWQRSTRIRGEGQVRHRIHRRVLVVTCATGLAVAGGLAAGAVGRAAGRGPVPGATASGVPPSSLGDIPGLGRMAPTLRSSSHRRRTRGHSRTENLRSPRSRGRLSVEQDRSDQWNLTGHRPCQAVRCATSAGGLFGGRTAAEEFHRSAFRPSPLRRRCPR